jgi:hypothetical protein
MSASKTGSSTIFNAACTMRSRTTGIDNGRYRSFNPGLGISTRRAGSGRYRRSRSWSATSPTSRSTPYSSTMAKVILSIPGAPLLLRTATHARASTSLRQTLCRTARGTSARDRPWPPGKTHAARHGPDHAAHPHAIPKRRN